MLVLGMKTGGTNDQKGCRTFSFKEELLLSNICFVDRIDSFSFCSKDSLHWSKNVRVTGSCKSIRHIIKVVVCKLSIGFVAFDSLRMSHITLNIL